MGKAPFCGMFEVFSVDERGLPIDVRRDALHVFSALVRSDVRLVCDVESLLQRR